MSNQQQWLHFDESISPLITQQIKAAKREIIFVSPYVKPWNHLERVLLEAHTRKVKRTLFYRRDANNFDPQSCQQLFDQLIPVDLLHAKIYCFDDIALLSSMNLYDFSQSSSREVAMWVTDTHQMQELRNYIESLSIAARRPNPLQGNSQRHSKTPAEKLARMGATVAAEFIRHASSSRGYCIRCGDSLKWDPDRPFCKDCFSEWRIYENDYYIEKVCHSCGKPARTSMDKPECLRCYKAGY